MSEYPGYKEPCNGCGLCCSTVPCAISSQFGLWKDGRCKALQQLPDRMICKVISNPRSVSIRLSKWTKQQRMDAIGSLGICDHRAAWSEEDAKALLAERNAVDELFGTEENTYPRACVLHLENGKYFCMQHSQGGDVEIERLIA